MLTRLIRNLTRLPARTLDSLERRRAPSYRHLAQAKAHALEAIAPDRFAELCAVPGNTSDWQCQLLFYFADTAPAGDGQLVEIGAFQGKSTAWLSEAARRTGKHLVSIDPLIQDSEAVFRETVERFAIEEVATLHKAFSHDVGADWRAPIALLWIDGGHDYDTVKQDILDFCPHVQPGGVVVFDDINEPDFPGLVRAVNETIKQNPDFEHLGEIKNTGLYRRR
ncbi:MAG: class I SAM-dependent methyltransferase [Planctomycetota bacterium]